MATDKVRDQQAWPLVSGVLVQAVLSRDDIKEGASGPEAFTLLLRRLMTHFDRVDTGGLPYYSVCVFSSITFVRISPGFITRPFRGVGVGFEEPHLRLMV